MQDSKLDLSLTKCMVLHLEVSQVRLLLYFFKIILVVSNRSHRVNYAMFKKWIEANQALTGFNLTEGLYKRLFSDLDPHKKGYLTETDWVNSFGCYSDSKQNL